MTASIDTKSPATSGQLATFRLDGDLYGTTHVGVEHVHPGIGVVPSMAELTGNERP